MTAQPRALYSATTPLIEIRGQSDFGVHRDLLDLKITAGRSGPRRLRLRLTATPTGASSGSGQSDPDILYLDGRLFDFGTEIAVSAGPADQRSKVFEGRVSRIDAIFLQGQPTEVEIHAEDRLMDLAMTRRTRTYENATLGDLLRQIAADHGLATDISVSGPAQDHVQQWNETDLGFLLPRLAELDADLWFADGKLRAAPRDDRRPNEMTLHAGAELQSLVFSADLAAQRNEVACGGYDLSAREALNGTSSAQDLASLTRGGRSGPQVLEAAFAPRASASRLGAVTSSGEARARAQAAHRIRARQFVTVRGIALTLPAMTVGTRLRFNGTGEMFGGAGFGVTEVCHAFDRQSGATTRFLAERATVNGGQ